MARSKLPNSEILRKKREREKKRRDELKRNPEKYEEAKKKESERYLKRKAEGKITLINDLSERGKRLKRKQWKVNNKQYQHNKRLHQVLINNLEASTPPSTPPASPDPSIIIQPSTSKKTSGRKKVRKDRSAAYRSITKVQGELKIMKRRAEKYKKRYRRLKNTRSNVNEATPKTHF